jgi:hypothetical protein
MAKEIVVDVVDKIGILADISEIVADHGVNVEALAGWGDGKKAQVMFITGDNLRAVDALKKKNYANAHEREVILLEMDNRPGVMKVITKRLADLHINIKHIYGTTCSCGGPAKMVLSTTDNEKAVIAFKNLQ